MMQYRKNQINMENTRVEIKYLKINIRYHIKNFKSIYKLIILNMILIKLYKT